MPAIPLTPWPLIALLVALPAAAQDAAPEPDADPAAEAPAPAPDDSALPAEAEGDPAPALTEPTSEAATSEAAEDGATPAEGDEAPLGLSLGDEGGEPQVGQVYVRDAFTDWELRCERVAEGEDPCQLYQLLEDQEGNAVAEISMFALPEGEQATAGATIVTPLMTLLTEQLTLSVDGGTAKRYPFSWCSAIGCIARVGFTDEEIASFRRGNTARLSIVPAAAPDQRVNLDVSLTGFTAGLQAVRDSGPVPVE